ncbi:MAG: P1 family peptidase [Burkholderiales bacterium]|nr:P1 family peptidase [Anaerolineae bacterium]
MNNSNGGLRARDLGIPFDGETGIYNAITDVAGVTVGHTTLIEGDGPLKVGKGPIRTGVTVILPRGPHYDPVFAGWYALNGNGEMTGTTWLEESGFLEGVIALTNTHSVGATWDAVAAWQIERGFFDTAAGAYWLLPVVAETYDGSLNDINGFHVKREHVFAALDGAVSGPVHEGCVGGGTGMRCHEFKGGIGTSSRKLTAAGESYNVGVLVQANHGRRRELTIAGVPVGKEIADVMPVYNRQPAPEPGAGSIIVIVATDAPLLPHQLKRLARRVPLGMARVGGIGNQTSGDIFLAFSTANAGMAHHSGPAELRMISNDDIDPLFEAAVQATEEAIINALVAATTMVGINGNTVYALPHDRLQDALRHYNRL